MTLRNLSITAKLTAASTMIILLFMSALGVLLVSFSTDSLQRANLDALTQQNRLIVEMVDAYNGALKDSTEKLAAIFAASVQGEAEVDIGEMVTVGSMATPVLHIGGHVMNLRFEPVDRFSELTGGVATVFVRKGDDFIRVTTSVKKENGQRAIGTALDHKHPGYAKVRAGEPYTGHANLFGHDYMTKYTPLRNRSGQVVAVLFVGLDFTEGLATLKRKIRAVKVGETGYVYALDAKPGPSRGTLVVHPAQEGNNISEATDASGHKFIQEILEKKSGVIQYPWLNAALGDTNARDKVVIYQYYPDWEWIIGTGSYLDEFTRSSAKLKQIIVGAILFMSLLMALTMIALSRSISRPIKELCDVMTTVSQHNDLTRRANTARGGELGQMARTFNEMLEKLGQFVQQVGQASTQLSAAAQSVAAVTEQAASNIQQQRLQTDQVATAMEEMTASVQEVARNATRTADAARHADGETSHGKDDVAAAVNSIGNLADEVANAARVIDALSKESAGIDQVLEVILAITEQTNLLALNAAIEAARAGEQGRGFAVVADEVRSLASRTQESATGIRQIIETLQMHAAQATVVMNSGRERATVSVEQAARAGTAFERIASAVAGITGMTAEIATTSEEQRRVTEEVTRNMMGISATADSTAAGAAQIARSSEDLRRLAQELNSMVAKYTA